MSKWQVSSVSLYNGDLTKDLSTLSNASTQNPEKAFLHFKVEKCLLRILGAGTLKWRNAFSGFWVLAL